MTLSPPPSGSAPAARCLVVKWDRIMADALVAQARSVMGAAEMEVFREGREAEQALEARPADLGLFGLTFPDEDGFDLLARIIRGKRVAKILVVSGRRDERTRELLRALPFDGYFDTAMQLPAVLPEAIRAVLAGRRWFSAIPDGRDAVDSRPPLSQLLSLTELQVFAIAGEGCDDVRVAERLGISEHTARTHRQHVMAKLGVQTSRELTVEAIRRGVTRVGAIVSCIREWRRRWPNGRRVRRREQRTANSEQRTANSE
jgi:DNA-binding NarL/FixJ family response regulator